MCISSKLSSAIAPVGYSTKMHVTIIIVFKAYEPIRGALKTHMGSSTDNVFYTIDNFRQVK